MYFDYLKTVPTEILQFCELLLARLRHVTGFVGLSPTSLRQLNNFTAIWDYIPSTQLLSACLTIRQDLDQGFVLVNFWVWHIHSRSFPGCGSQ